VKYRVPMNGAGHSRLWRGAFSVTLSVGMAASTFSQFVFGVLAQFLIDEFDISRTQLGLLTTAAFVVGGVLSPSAGGLVDRIGGRRIFVASMALVILATAGMSVAPSYVWMLLGSALVGFALASCNPTTNKLISAHTVPGERGVIMGVKQAGVQFGAFVIGFTLPALASTFDWRVAMASTILLPAICIAGTLLLIPSDRTEHLERRSTRESGELLPTVGWMATYAFLMGGGVAAISAYLPLYAQEEVGLSAGDAGMIAGIMGGIGILSRVAWGWGTERIGEFSIALAILGAGAVAATAAVYFAPGGGALLLWISAVVFGMTAITWNAIGMLVIVAEIGTHAAGRASGIVQSGFYAGFVVTPSLFGYSVDRSGEWTIGWVGVALMFVAATVVAGAWRTSRRKATGPQTAKPHEAAVANERN